MPGAEGSHRSPTAGSYARCQPSYSNTGREQRGLWQTARSTDAPGPRAIGGQGD